ncbi:CBS domain-containing protein [Dactylosporangium sp. AC04546]|uniref:CBS domain-containing protein n=1 Tax=Dactylosporangium sp. AC04546 TaxID=2862460 RepID=UPI0027E03545|nr:CBS domain-containing protein [Dactylosporangium sp. AC04546]WVK89147.1 CBS domain-containing protein [Dactylosporangium sp. AC04546]
MAFDRVKASAKRGLETGRARVEQTRAQRQRAGLLQELGEVCYAEHTGKATREAVAGKLGALDDYERTLRERQSARQHARDIMHPEAECVGEGESLVTAARRMRDLGVGSLPICGPDDRLHGMITDRDITVKCVAEGQDPNEVHARDLAQERLIWVDAGADVDEVLRKMEHHQIKRLPVIENRRLVGIISEADLARNVDEHRLAEFAEKVYARS